jgi:hypothetical protein
MNSLISKRKKKKELKEKKSLFVDKVNKLFKVKGGTGKRKTISDRRPFDVRQKHYEKQLSLE